MAMQRDYRGLWLACSKRYGSQREGGDVSAAGRVPWGHIQELGSMEFQRKERPLLASGNLSGASCSQPFFSTEGDTVL